MSRFFTNATASLFGGTRYAMSTGDATVKAVPAFSTGYQARAIIYTCTPTGILGQVVISAWVNMQFDATGQITIPCNVGASNIPIPENGGVATKIEFGSSGGGVTGSSPVFYSPPQNSKVIPSGTHNIVAECQQYYDGDLEVDYCRVHWGAGVTYAPDTLIAAAGVAPSIPTDFAVSSDTNSNTLTWTRSAGATAYEVYRGTSPSPTALLATIGDVATYDDLSPYTLYYYRIKAKNGSGVSGYTADASGVSGVAPSTPSITSAVCDIHGGGVITVQQGSSNTSGFRLWRSDNGGAYREILAAGAFGVEAGTGGSWTITDYRPDKYQGVGNPPLEYNEWGDSVAYKVMATNLIGSSAQSADSAPVVLSQDMDAVVNTKRLPLMRAYWMSLPYYVDVSASGMSTQNDLARRAFLYYADPTPTNLEIVVNQWEAIVAEVGPDNIYLAPDGGGGFFPLNIDHMGRLITAVLGAMRVLTATDQSALAADMLDKAGLWSEALLRGMETGHSMAGIGINNWLGTTVSFNRFVDSPNQMMSMAAAMALLWASPESMHYHSDAIYGGYSILQLINGAVSFTEYMTWWEGDEYGGSPWGFSDFAPRRIHGGYHIATMRHMKTVASWVGDQIPNAATMLEAMSSHNAFWFEYEYGGPWTYDSEGDNYKGVEYFTDFYRNRLAASWSMFPSDPNRAGDFAQYKGVSVGGTNPIRYDPLVSMLTDDFILAAGSVAPPVDIVTTQVGDEAHLSWVNISVVNEGLYLEMQIDGGAWAPAATLGLVESAVVSLPNTWASAKFRIAGFTTMVTSLWAESNTLTPSHSIDWYYGEAHVTAAIYNGVQITDWILG